MKAITGIILTSLIISGCGGGGGEGADENEAAKNSAPEISGRPAEMVRAGDTFAFTPTATDADGDLLEFSVENLPAWAYFDAGSGGITGYPEKADHGSWDDIVIQVSDGKKSTRFSFALDVLPALLGRQNFDAGELIADGDGFRSAPTLTMSIDGEERQFTESNLQLKFNAEGDLLEMAGEAVVPPRVSEHMSLDAAAKADVDYYSGREINANPDIDILLKDHQYYQVFHFKAGIDITLQGDPGSGDEKKIEIGTPLNPEALLISDPSDSMYYVYGNMPFVGAGGFGVSESGLIPFEPMLDYAQLDSFDGHTIEKAEIGLGVKIFDLFAIEGTRVTRLQNFNKILFDEGFFDDPFDSGVEYKSGINGIGEFAFGVVGFEIFSFDLTEVSAMLDVGFERQHLAMRSRTAPDLSWLPESFVFVPETETIGDWYIDGDGSYEVVLGSTYRSGLPEASVDGEITLRDGEITLSGKIEHEQRPLGLDVVFFPGGLNAEIDVLFDLDLGQRDAVIAVMDDKIDEVRRAAEELQRATDDYAYELSLRGTREQIPTIVQAVKNNLNPLPGQISSAVYNGVLNKIKESGWAWAVDEKKIARDKANSARSQAQDTVDNIMGKMNALKAAAALGDEEDYKAAIKAALKAALDHKTFSRRFTFRHKILGTNRTLYDKTHSKNVLTGGNLTRVQAAYDNIGRIDESHSYRLEARQIYAALPLEQAVADARREVEEGTPDIPRLEGLGYSVEGDVYSAYAILDGKVYDLDFNPLNPDELVEGLARMIAEQLI